MKTRESRQSGRRKKETKNKVKNFKITNEDTGALKGEVTCPNKIADEGRARTQHSVSYTKAFYLN